MGVHLFNIGFIWLSLFLSLVCKAERDLQRRHQKVSGVMLGLLPAAGGKALVSLGTGTTGCLDPPGRQR